MAYEASPRESSGRRGMRYAEGYQRGRSRNFGQEEYRDEGYSDKRARDYSDDAPRSKRPRDYGAGNQRDRDRYSGPRFEDRRGARREEGAGGDYERRDTFDRYNGDSRGYNRGGFRRGSRRGGASERGPPRRDRTPPAPSRVLGVFGLSARTEEHDLYDVFCEFGRVDDIQMVYDALTGRSRGFGFIYFEDIDSAIAAREGLSRGLELHGRIVRIDYSKTESAHAPTPGVFMGKDRRRGSYHPPSRVGGRGGFGSRSRNFTGRGGPRGSRPQYGSRSRSSRSRSRSPQSGRSYSLTPPSRNRRTNAQAGATNAPSSTRPRNRTQSSSRSRSPPPVLPSGGATRRRTNHRADDGYAYNEVNGNAGGGGSIDEERGGRQRDDWSDAASASSLT